MKIRHIQTESNALTSLDAADLPDEARIVRSILEITGIEHATDRSLGHATIPFLDDLCKLRALRRQSGIDVPPFQNAILRRYEGGEITETGLWERFEAAARALNV